MSRIFGAVDFGERGNPAQTLDEMFKAVPHWGREPAGYRKSSSSGVALGLMLHGTIYESGMRFDEAEGVGVAYCGFVPEWPEIFTGERLSAEAEPAINVATLYKRYGNDFLRRLSGMFSLALYDKPRGKLIVASDQSGYFPVYYSISPDRFVFSSSIKAVKRFTDPLIVNRGACIEHLLFDAVFGSQTYYEGIEAIPYGTFVELDITSRTLRRGRYFSYEELFDADEYEASRKIDAPAELSEKLKEALKKILSSVDRSTLALSCGGGIDCSYIGALLNEMNEKLPMFCTNVMGTKVSESVLAEEAAGKLGVELYLSNLTERDFYPLILRSILDYDEPIVHPSMPKFYVSSDVKWETGRLNQIMGVASDLLFGGIGNVKSFYRYLKIKGLLRFIPTRSRRVLSSILDNPQSVDVELRMRNKLYDLALVGMGNFERAAMQRRIEGALSVLSSPNERAVKTLMLENLSDYQQHLLNRRYEASTSHGFSLLFPFLDRKMLRFAVNLAVTHCIDWKYGKLVVRKAASQYFGRSFFSRKKYGGDVPIKKWVPPMSFLLKGGFVEDFFSLEYDTMRKTLHKSPKLLWNIIDLELWGRLSLLDESPHELVEKMRAKGIDSADYQDWPT